MAKTNQWRIQFQILTTSHKVDPTDMYHSVGQTVSTGSSSTLGAAVPPLINVSKSLEDFGKFHIMEKIIT